jgi:SPP1 gp7 family putative phage head morphogenesis protein
MESDGEIQKVIKQYRRDLLAKERSAASELVRVYGEAWKRIKAELERLHTEYEAAKARGEKVDVSWIYQYNRARAFRDQVERELLTFAQYADGKIREQQFEAIEAAESHAERLTRLALGKPPAGLAVSWNRIDRASVETLLGMTQAESPLHQLLLSIAAAGAKDAEKALVQGMLLGRNPREVAVDLRRALGTTLSRALTIARTETLRAHREATRASYQANSDIVKGWIWHSALDTRTCAMCWAMHGTEHSIDEVLDDHPNGRCSMIPKTSTWEEIGAKYGIDLSGIPDTNPVIESGISQFEKLPAEQQIAILGQAKYKAWKDGQFTLSDLVGRKRSKIWGTMRYEKSLNKLQKKVSRSINNQVMPKIKSVDEIRELADKVGKPIYVRWSANPAADLKRGYSLRHGTAAEAGLSAVEIDPTWPEWRIIRQLGEYQFLGGRLWIVTGRQVGLGGDNEPVLRDVKYIAEIDRAFATKDWLAVWREEAIAARRADLEKITDEIGRRIVMRELEQLLSDNPSIWHRIFYST